MPLFKVLAVLAVTNLAVSNLAVSNLAVSTSAWAGPTSAAGTKGKAQSSPLAASEAKPASPAAEEAPIVMGRSVAVTRKSKLHHIKAKPANPSPSPRN